MKCLELEGRINLTFHYAILNSYAPKTFGLLKYQSTKPNCYMKKLPTFSRLIKKTYFTWQQQHKSLTFLLKLYEIIPV